MDLDRREELAAIHTAVQNNAASSTCHRAWCDLENGCTTYHDYIKQTPPDQGKGGVPIGNKPFNY